MNPMRPRSEPTGSAGYTVTEMLMVIAIMGTLAGMSIAGFSHAMMDMRGSANLKQVTAQLNMAKELAINQRRTIEIHFLTPNQIQLIRREVPNGTTVLNTVTLENNVQFTKFGSLPDTPDAFGNAAAVDFGSAGTLMFLSDGTFVDGTAAPLNGTVFLGVPNQLASARAVTILGASGHVQAYRWNGTAWGH